MRQRRIRNDSRPTYYHLIGRVAGTRDDRPFDDVDRRKFVGLLRELASFYTIDIIDFVVMSNHYHIVVCADHQLPAPAVAVERFNAYYQNKVPPQRLPLPLTVDHPDLERVQRRLRDISCLAKDLQQRFTSWYNRTRRPEPRRGTLWESRFKSVVLEGRHAWDSAVWNCVKYIALNPVRAHIVEDPADYRFSSWGMLCGSGCHPFAASFFKHMRIILGPAAAALADDELVGRLRADMAATIAAERGADRAAAEAVYDQARQPDATWLRFCRRTRYWSDGAIIGTKSFVVETAAFWRDAAWAQQHRCAKTRLANGQFLTVLRNLRRSLE